MPNAYDRREFLLKSARTAAGLAAAAGAGSLLSACSSGGAPKVRAYQQRYTPGGTPKYGGTINFGVEAEESGFDPTSAHFDSTGVMYARTVYDPLAIALADGTVVPYLAQSITPNADFTQWKITMRPNIIFHDGEPCDGAALKFCLDQCKASALVNFALTYMTGTSYTKSDPLSVTVNMNAPWVAFPAWLCGYIGGQIAYPFSPKQFNAHGPGGFSLLNSHPIGTGPFKFQSWQAGTKFTAVRNPNYWRTDTRGKPLPYLDSISFLPIPIVGDRFSALTSGSIDIMHTDDPLTILSLRKDTQFQEIEDDASPVEHDMSFAMINCASPPLDDLRVRMAMAYAFDQKDWLKVEGRGVDLPSTGPFAPGSPYYVKTGFPQYDLAKAKQLLKSYMDDKGVSSVKVSYGTTQTTESEASAAVVERYMQAAGFDVTITTIQQSALINDAVFGEFQILGWRQFANVDPDCNYVFWESAGAAAGLSVNFSRLKDPVIQAAIDKGRQSQSVTDRVDAYQTVSKRFAQQIPYVWSNEDVWSIGAQSWCRNFNSPTDPTGKPALGMLSGIVMPTQIWSEKAPG